jgi:hypothetical protein
LARTSGRPRRAETRLDRDPDQRGAGLIDLEFLYDPAGPLKYEDVQDGLLDAAVLTVYAFDRANLADGLNVIFWGDVTDIRRGNFGFIEISAEGPTNRQTDVLNKTYQSPCRISSPAPRCGMTRRASPMPARSFRLGSLHHRVGTGGQGDDFFNVGLFRLTSGGSKPGAGDKIVDAERGQSGARALSRLRRHPSAAGRHLHGAAWLHARFQRDARQPLLQQRRRYGGEPRLEADDSDVVHVAAEATDEGG